VIAIKPIGLWGPRLSPAADANEAKAFVLIAKELRLGRSGSRQRLGLRWQSISGDTAFARTELIKSPARWRESDDPNAAPPPPTPNSQSTLRQPFDI